MNITYSERVTAETAGDTGNYALSGGASVDSVQVVDDWRVMLGTSRLTAGTDYTLTLNGIQDQSGNENVIEPNTKIELVGPELSEGFVIWEYYADIPGTSVDALVGHASFPADPAQRQSLRRFSTNPELQNFADNFGARMSAWITPTESGQYRFFIRSDDASELWFSPTSNMNQAALIAEETGCCNAFLEPTDGDGNLNLETSEPQNLTAGTSYYIEAVYKEGGGGDHCEVAWRKEGDSTPAAELNPIAGEFLSSYVLAAEPEILGITYDAELNTITIEYVGILERADTVEGDYQPIPGAESPLTFVPNESSQAYFRSVAP